MKKIILLISVFSCPLFASTATVSMPVKAAVTSATCSLTADAEVNFGSITALAINNNTVPEKEIRIEANCDWTTKGLNLSFIPGAIVAGDDKTMQSGLAGVGFKLPTLDSISNLSFNTEHIWFQYGFGHGGTRIIFAKIKPVKIPSEDIVAGNIDTTLTIRLSYD